VWAKHAPVQARGDCRGVFPTDEREAYPVSTLVNSPGNDVANCVRRAG
jgi:hypothetical protein